MSNDAQNAESVPTTYARLTEHFPPEAHKTLQARGGQTYVPWNLVAGRLNDVLGVTGWSFSVEREGFTPNEAWVLGQLVATIDGEQCVRQQYGCADIMLGQSPNTDLLKKAGTDALKKCAQTLGVALYLTDADERAEVRAAQQAQQREAARPKAAPESTDRVRDAAVVTGAAPAWERPAAEAEYKALAKKAVGLDHPKSQKLKDTLTSSLSDDVLVASIQSLQKWLESQAVPF